MILAANTDGNKVLLGPRDLFPDPIVAAAAEMERLIIQGADLNPILDKLARLAQPVGRGRR